MDVICERIVARPLWIYYFSSRNLTDEVRCLRCSATQSTLYTKMVAAVNAAW